LEALAGAAPTRLRGPHVEKDLDMHEFGSAAGDTVATTNTNNTWNAPGLAGQIPDPGDEYNAQARIEQDTSGVDYDGEISGRQRYPGPTSAAGRQRFRRTRKSQPGAASVHVPAPLPNISVSYAATVPDDDLISLVPKDPRRIRNLPNVDYTKSADMLHIVKADTEQQLVYGVVLEPLRVDTQDDWMHPDDIEYAAHNYLKKAVRGKASVAKLQHQLQGFFKNKPGVVPVESFIAPSDFKYPGSDELVLKGSWVLCVHVEDRKTWEDVLDGKFTGFSIGGSGIRDHAASFPVAEVPHMWIGNTQPSDWAPQPPYTG
jgi:hypothetical protein